MQFFLQIWNKLKILRFLVPILIFQKHFFGVLLVLFGNFGAKCAPYGAKYVKMFFLRGLEFYFLPIPIWEYGVFSKIHKSAAPYPNVHIAPPEAAWGYCAGVLVVTNVVLSTCESIGAQVFCLYGSTLGHYIAAVLLDILM